MATALPLGASFDLEELSRTLITKKNVRKTSGALRITFYAILFFLISYTVWFFVDQLLTPSPAIEKIVMTVQRGETISADSDPLNERDSFSRQDALRIKNTKLFGNVQQVTETPDAEPAAEPLAPLNVTLIGTFVSSPTSSVAIIEEKKKKTQEVFAVGDDVFGQAELKAIYANRVEVSRDGKVETLTIDDSPAPSGPSASSADAEEIVVDEQELETALENLPLLLTQARAVPYFKQGKSVGLRLFAIKTGSLYEKLGLKNGDILKNINGNNLGDFSQAMKLFEMLKEERSLNLDLERNREEKAFHFRIQ